MNQRNSAGGHAVIYGKRSSFPCRRHRGIEGGTVVRLHSFLTSALDEVGGYLSNTSFKCLRVGRNMYKHFKTLNQMELNGTLQSPGSFTLREPSLWEETGYDPQPIGRLCVTETFLSLAGNWRPILWSLRPQRSQYAHQTRYTVSHNTSTEEHNTNLIVSYSTSYFLLHRSKYYLQNTVLRNPQLYVIPSTMDSKVHVFNM
jgi:hypothetical protein